MYTIQQNIPWSVQDRTGRIQIDRNRLRLIGALAALFTLFVYGGRLLQIVDPAAGVLDIGILTVVLLGLIGGVVAIYCSVWLQELLWKPFRVFRKEFNSHFNQLTSWQQCILYFSVFFLLLYAVIWGLAIVF